MNLLLVRADELDQRGRVALVGRRADHLIRVIAVQPGRAIKVGILGGDLVLARVVRATTDQVDLQLSGERSAAPRELPVSLLLAVPRPKVLGRVLRLSAAFGLTRIDLTNAWRVEKSFFASHRLHSDDLEHHLLLGCEQGGHTHLPRIRVHRFFRQLVEHCLPSPSAKELRLVAHPGATEPLSIESFPPGISRVIIAIGPEGGWIDEELSSLRRAGFQACALARGVLNVETACAATLGQLELLLRSTSAR
jgi:RsmE family RNA methyltransferase